MSNEFVLIQPNFGNIDYNNITITGSLTVADGANIDISGSTINATDSNIDFSNSDINFDGTLLEGFTSNGNSFSSPVTLSGTTTLAPNSTLSSTTATNLNNSLINLTGSTINLTGSTSTGLPPPSTENITFGGTTTVNGTLNASNSNVFFTSPSVDFTNSQITGFDTSGFALSKTVQLLLVPTLGPAGMPTAGQTWTYYRVGNKVYVDMPGFNWDYSGTPTNIEFRPNVGGLLWPVGMSPSMVRTHCAIRVWQGSEIRRQDLGWVFLQKQVTEENLLFDFIRFGVARENSGFGNTLGESQRVGILPQVFWYITDDPMPY